MLFKLSFKSKDGAVEGEIGVIPEHDDSNSKGYEAIIPKGSKCNLRPLEFEEAQEMMLQGIKHKGNY